VTAVVNFILGGLRRGGEGKEGGGRARCLAHQSEGAAVLNGNPRHRLPRISQGAILTTANTCVEMSDSEQEMALRLASIKTLRESYKAGVLRAVESPKYPLKAALLDRVSLWSVASANKSRLESDYGLLQARRYHQSRNRFHRERREQPSWRCGLIPSYLK